MTGNRGTTESHRLYEPLGGSGKILGPVATGSRSLTIDDSRVWKRSLTKTTTLGSVYVYEVLQ